MKGDLSELYTELGKEVLPEEYGGDNGTLAEIEGMSLLFSTSSHTKFLHGIFCKFE